MPDPSSISKINKPLTADIHLYRRLFAEARPYGLLIAFTFFVDMLAVPLALLIPIPLKVVVDHVLGARPLGEALQGFLSLWAEPDADVILIFSVALLIVVALLRQLQELASALLHSFTGSRLVLDFRARLFRHVQRLSLKYHDTFGSSDSTYRIQYDAPAIQHIAIDGLIPLVSSFLSLCAMVYVIARMDWVLAIVALIISPILFGLSRYYRRPLRRGYHRLKDHESLALGVVHEVLSAVRLVKAFGREDQEQQRYLQHAREGVRSKIKVALFQGGFDLLVGLTIGIGTACVLYFGVLHVREGILTLGGLLVIMSYLAQLYAPLRTLSNKSADIQGSLASAERAFQLLEREPDVAEKHGALHLSRATGHFRFENVQFAYDPKQPVLKGITADIPAGSRVGIAGRTGAGKSTLISLITRFYDVTAGAILLDGKDLRDYKVTDLRNQFAIVLQEPVLFSTTIAENIAYGKPQASEQEIIAAARAAHAHEFISNLEQGYESRVGERGMKLSGGERQRISLARAFLKNAPILILDEPTSSVDVKTEALIMDALQELMRGRTTFMIAHRLSTLESCDVRLNLEHGMLVAPASAGAGDVKP